MGNIFNDDFIEFIQVLNHNEVEYILVGGFSVILHGHSRVTGDMDNGYQDPNQTTQGL